MLREVALLFRALRSSGQQAQDNEKRVTDKEADTD